MLCVRPKHSDALVTQIFASHPMSPTPFGGGCDSDARKRVAPLSGDAEQAVAPTPAGGQLGDFRGDAKNCAVR